MNILVVGGSGFLGSYVVDALVERGHSVAIFDRRANSHAPEGVVVSLGDVLDLDAVRKAVAGRDVVYNFAGQPDIGRSLEDPAGTIKSNIIGNTHILEACRLEGVSRVVFASTAYVFSQDGAFYGVSKRSAEMIIEEYGKRFGLDYTIIRYGSVYGERAGDSNRIHRILKQALTEGRIDFPGDGSEEREYIHARDAAKLSVDVLDDAYRNQHVILTGTERFNYSELLQMVNEILGGHLVLDYQGKDYVGHYRLTPYSYAPSVSRKLVSNPGIDFGQGLLNCIDAIFSALPHQQQERFSDRIRQRGRFFNRS